MQTAKFLAKRDISSHWHALSHSSRQPCKVKGAASRSPGQRCAPAQRKRRPAAPAWSPARTQSSAPCGARQLRFAVCSSGLQKRSTCNNITGCSCQDDSVAAAHESTTFTSWKLYTHATQRNAIGTAADKCKLHIFGCTVQAIHACITRSAQHSVATSSPGTAYGTPICLQSSP